jgi:transcriptional regulator
MQVSAVKSALPLEVLVVFAVEAIGEEGDHPGLDVAVELLELIVLWVEAVPKRIEMNDALLERTRPAVVNVEDGRGVGSRHCFVGVD